MRNIIDKTLLSLLGAGFFICGVFSFLVLIPFIILFTLVDYIEKKYNI